MFGKWYQGACKTRTVSPAHTFRAYHWAVGYLLQSVYHGIHFFAQSILTVVIMEVMDVHHGLGAFSGQNVLGLFCRDAGAVFRIPDDG